MQQDSNVVALRLAPDHGRGASKRESNLACIPQSITEDLGWVLGQFREPCGRADTKQSNKPAGAEIARTSRIPTRVAGWVLTGALACVAVAFGASPEWPEWIARELSRAAPQSSGNSANGRPAIAQASHRASERQGLDVSRTADAAKVQQRLAELGFFTAPITGSFGPLSRQALRDFKTRTGLVADDAWNTEIQARLFDPNAPKADRRAATEPPKADDPGKPADAAQAQKRLAELGFFTGRIDGAWGPASRAALRDFKVVNGLIADDRWDALTSAFLDDDQALSAGEGFLGTWAADPGECRYGADAALRISARRAESPFGACSFGPVERDRLGWRMKASCAANGASWNAAVRLMVSGGRLRWSSERGTAVYVRCAYGTARGPLT